MREKERDVRFTKVSQGSNMGLLNLTTIKTSTKCHRLLLHGIIYRLLIRRFCRKQIITSTTDAGPRNAKSVSMCNCVQCVIT